MAIFSTGYDVYVLLVRACW